MYYKKVGSSKKFIVFLHGWGSSGNVFSFLNEMFEDDYSLLYLDFTGFGMSSQPSHPMTISDYVLELKAVLDEFDIESLNIVAHSFGGRVAIKFLFYFQQNYKNVRLCLIDSAGILPRRGLRYKYKVWKYKRLKVKALVNPKIRERLCSFGSDDYRELNDVMKQTFVNVVNEDLAKYAKFISCKTLIVWGSKDKDTKPYMAKKLKKCIKYSTLVFLKDVGHFSFVEKKEEFAFVLDRFLKSL